MNLIFVFSSSQISGVPGLMKVIFDSLIILSNKTVLIMQSVFSSSPPALFAAELTRT